VVIQVRDLRGRLGRATRDFEEGFLKDVAYDEIGDALIISTERQVIPYIDCVFGDEGHNQFPMLLRLDIETGSTIGVFQSAPRLDSNAREKATGQFPIPRETHGHQDFSKSLQAAI